MNFVSKVHELPRNSLYHNCTTVLTMCILLSSTHLNVVPAVSLRCRAKCAYQGHCHTKQNNHLICLLLWQYHGMKSGLLYWWSTITQVTDSRSKIKNLHIKLKISDSKMLVKLKKKEVFSWHFISFLSWEVFKSN